MRSPTSPDEDDQTGVDNSLAEESLEGFYQAVFLDDLFSSVEADGGEDDGIGGSDLQPRHRSLREAAPPAAGGSCPLSETRLSADAPEVPPNPNSLAAWVAVYFRSHANRAAPKTLSAKRLDLERFLNFYFDTLGHDHVDAWVPELTRAFLHELREKPSPNTGKRLAPASIRRYLATVRHFARWAGERHQFPTAPLQGVLSPRIRPPPPAQISRATLRRIWRACRDRVDDPHRRDQCPLLDAAVFQLLVSTDLRPRELVALDLDDYHSKGLHGAFRRGSQVRTKTWVPAEARRWLERYLNEVRGPSRGPLFVTREGERFQSKGIRRLSQRIGATSASTSLRARSSTSTKPSDELLPVGLNPPASSG